MLSLAAGFAPRFIAHRLSDRRLEDLTGVAAGLLLASALLVVIPEGFHVAAEGASGSEVFVADPVVLGGAILAGFVAMLLLEGFGVGHAVHEEHHDHVEGHGHGHVHHPTSTGVLAIGLTVHAMADGLAIGSAAVAGDTAFSVLVALAVLLHRIPAGFSLGLFALHSSPNPAAAARGVTAFALATPITIMASYLLLHGATDRLVAIAMLFSAGTFVYVATVDTLPAIHNPETGRRSVMNVLAGAGLFTLVFAAIDLSGLLDHGH
ncbi:MAG: ZIP family metal transporter [Acidimicrobiales bacterium]